MNLNEGGHEAMRSARAVGGSSFIDQYKGALADHVRPLRKSLWIILGAVVAAAAIAALVSLLFTPIYRSTATVLIESGKGKVLAIEDGTTGMQQSDNYQTQVEILRSREVAQRTAAALNLWKEPEFDPRLHRGGGVTALWTRLRPGAAATSEASDAELLDAGTDNILRNLTIEPVRLSQLVRVEFDASDPQLAARVANTLAEQYIAADREAHSNLTQQISNSLQDRLTSLRDRLGASERALQTYREQHNLVSIDGASQGFSGQQVNATTDKLLAARARKLELESAYLQLKAIHNGDYGSSPTVMRDAGVIESVRELNDVDRRLQEMSATLGPRNEKVIRAVAEKQQIETTLAQQRAQVVAAVAREYEAARSTEESLERALGDASKSVQDTNRGEFELTVLEREAKSDRELYELFMNRAKETNLAGEVQPSVARVVDRAVPSEAPIKPARKQMVVGAALLALVISTFVLVMIDRLDDTIRSEDDVKSTLNISLLGSFPKVLTGGDSSVFQSQEVNSRYSEAVRTVRTAVASSQSRQNPKIILVTSALPGEGKTTVSLNLALAYARVGRTLLIDADLRQSGLSRGRASLEGGVGLAEVVQGDVDLADCIRAFPGSDLSVLTGGSAKIDPLEVFMSRRFQELLKTLGTRYEVILIDSPPVELVSEALVVAPLATGVVFVAKALSTPAALAQKSLRRLEEAGGTLVGLVLNEFESEHSRRYYGAYFSDAPAT